ncbi:WD40/YVTN/BNR-like repeat-containing protein [Alicyclobacillus ferrooxydans]|uniref:Photosynthesis system II assembly factor Ycf48/Hcf136-like domain-containing protein n=1 Tax=Alicyclobacillus ferrooxydans TaxID=471514 RepID=A0A0P9CA56_9BACL|nr:hypothetical protein [Alicyclobacillus ferrooxydans]KPV42177.1 hypothetical protein AN477_19260 [Alicyclobacillus ferrooxydans]
MKRKDGYSHSRLSPARSLFIAGAVVATLSMVAGCGVSPASHPGHQAHSQANHGSNNANSLGTTKSSVSNSGASGQQVALSNQGEGANQTGSANASAEGSGTAGNGASNISTLGTTSNTTSGSNLGQASNGTVQVRQTPLSALSAYSSQVVPSFSPSSLQFVDTTHGFLAGGGYVYGTADGGRSFQQLYHFTGQVLKVDFLSPTTGFALVASGANATGAPTGLQLFKTMNGGTKWSPLTPASSSPFANLDLGQRIYLHFTDAQNGTISFSRTAQETAQGTSKVPATILVTKDGGVSWTQLPAPTQAEAVAYADPLHGVALVSNKTGFSVEWTNDGGQSWSVVYQKSFGFQVTGQVWMTSASTAYVQIDGGYGMTQQSYTLIRTGDSGQTWNTLIASATGGGGPAPGVPDAGASTAGPGLIPGALDVLSGTKAVLPGAAIPEGPSGLVYVGETEDGIHWQNSPEKMPGQNGMVSFVNPNTGWLVTSTDGQFGDVFQTTDGGASWQFCYQFVFGQSAVQSGRVTPLTYSETQLQQIYAVAKADAVSLYLPTAGLDNEQFSIVKTNGDGSVGLVYNHIWVIESNQPIPQPTGGSPVASFDEQLANGSVAHYSEMYNTDGQLNKFLYFKVGNTYISITYLQQNSPYSDREFVQIADSFSLLQASGGSTS